MYIQNPRTYSVLRRENTVIVRKSQCRPIQKTALASSSCQEEPL